MCDVCLLWHDTKTLLVTKIFKNSLWLIISRWHFPKFITMPCKEFSVYCSPSEPHGKPRLVCSNIKPPRFFYYRATCLSDAVFPEAERQIRQTQRASELLFTALMRCEKQSKKKKKGNCSKWYVKVIVRSRRRASCYWQSANNLLFFVCKHLPQLQSVPLQSQWTEKYTYTTVECLARKGGWVYITAAWRFILIHS